MNVRTDLKMIVDKNIAQQPHAGVKSIQVGAEFNPTTNTTEVVAEFELDTDVYGAPQLAAGTEIAAIFDASRSAIPVYEDFTINDMAKTVLGYLMPLDTSGVDVMLHSLKAEPYRVLGAFKKFSDVDTILARLERRDFGSNTVLAPSLMYLLNEVKSGQYVGKNMFVEVVTDGAFHDVPEIIEAIGQIIRELGISKSQNTNRFKIHITGFNVADQDMATLKQLDDALEGRFGADILDMDLYSEVAGAPGRMLKEIKANAVVMGEDGEVTVRADGKKVVKVGDSGKGSFSNGFEYLGFEQMPSLIRLGFTIEGNADKAEVLLNWTKNGQPCQPLTLNLRLK